MKKLRLLFILSLLAVYSQFAISQMDPNAPLPVDESVRYGVLENGMTY